MPMRACAYECMYLLMSHTHRHGVERAEGALHPLKKSHTSFTDFFLLTSHDLTQWTRCHDEFMRIHAIKTVAVLSVSAVIRDLLPRAAHLPKSAPNRITLLLAAISSDFDDPGLHETASAPNRTPVSMPMRASTVGASRVRSECEIG